MRTSLLCAALLFLGTSATLMAEDYEIVFRRDGKVGAKTAVTASLSWDDTEKFVQNGKKVEAPERRQVHVELTGQREDLAVNSNGHVSETKLVVTTCACVQDGVAKPLFKPQDVILFKVANPAVITVNGNPPDRLQSALLPELLPLPRYEDADRDARFYGPKRKVKVGETWPGDAEIIRSDMEKASGMKLPAGALQCQAKLESVRTVDGIPCLQVTMETNIKTTGIAFPEIPALTADTFETSFKVTRDYPLDKNLPCLSESVEMRQDASGDTTLKRRDGATLRTEFHQIKNHKLQLGYKPLP